MKIPEILGKHPVKVLGALDSPLWMNLKPLYTDITGVTDMMKNAHQNFNVGSVIPSDCAQRHKDKEWRCVFGEYRLDFVHTPFVMFADQYDAYQMGVQMHKAATDKDLDDYQKEYAENFAAFTNEYLEEFAFPSVNTTGEFKGAIHSVSCGTHAISTSPKFYKMKTIATPEHEALS